MVSGLAGSFVFFAVCAVDVLPHHTVAKITIAVDVRNLSLSIIS
jgi:hypothetical protein